MEDIKLEQLAKVNEKEFGIILFYADGCHHCKRVKPIFEDYSNRIDSIKFLTMDINEGKDYYDKYAERISEIIYEPIEGSNDLRAVAQFNEDGTPKMVIKYSVPGFFVHHKQAITEENKYGFIGGFDGANPEELDAIVSQLLIYEA